ncbi:uncharacterized protein [Setaria viridis]|uniref:uncharacterized protein n=1 Tax=Setaria viridis TaxID=4556 RepID=UPI001493AD85|nr:uncharacterized protein LOC117834246 [Setaria viridis]
MSEPGVAGSVEIGGNSGSSGVQKSSLAGKKLNTAKDSESSSRRSEAKAIKKLELKAAGALAGLKLKKAGKKFAVRIVDALYDDDDEVGFLDDGLSLVSPLRGLLENKDCGAFAEKETSPEAAGTSETVVAVLPVAPDAKDATEQLLPTETVGTTEEPYREPSFLLRVDPLPEDSDLPQYVLDYNKAFSTDLKEKLLAIHVPGAGEDDDLFNPPLLWSSQDSLRIVGEAAEAVLVDKSKADAPSEVLEEGKLAKEKEIVPKETRRIKVPASTETQDSFIDPEEYESSLRCYGPDHLARITATLGYKAVIAGKVAVDKLQDKEKAMLERSTKILSSRPRLLSYGRKTPR